MGVALFVLHLLLEAVGLTAAATLHCQVSMIIYIVKCRLHCQVAVPSTLSSVSFSHVLVSFTLSSVSVIGAVR